MKFNSLHAALIEALKIQERLKDIVLPITTTDAKFYLFENYKCRILQVNPAKSFEIENEFEFYVVVQDEEEKFQQAFPYEKVCSGFNYVISQIIHNTFISLKAFYFNPTMKAQSDEKIGIIY